MDAKLGVIGGMGPKATAIFFERVVENTVANKDQDHINMIVLNHATLPDRTSAILANSGDEFLKEIKQDFELLEKAGVLNIAIPCNTSHYYYDDMQKMTKVNIINMIEETIKKIHSMYGEHAKVGILATKGTIKSGIYREACNKYNLELHTHDEYLQDQVMKIIYDVKSDITVNPTELEDIIKKLIEEEKCKCVILACTELSIIKVSDEISTYCIDAMDVLVERSIELSGKIVK